MNAERAAREIKRAYGTFAGQYGQGWMMLAEVANRVDMDHDSLTAGVLFLMRTEDRFHVIPESNQKVLTKDERAAAVWIGNQWRHLIGWQ
jgi:hypothetical protein